MREIVRSPSFAVFDDVLSPEARRELLAHFERESWRSVHSELDSIAGVGASGAPVSHGAFTARNKVWRLHDGEAYTTAGAVSRSAPPSKAATHPTGTALDPVFEAVETALPAVEDLVGRVGEGIRYFTAAPFLYPAGSRLSWHSDVGAYTGAYVYYAHDEWNPQWGGELLLADDVERPSGFRQPFLDNRVEARLLLERGVGHFVMPKPNRLVVLARGTFHAMARVDVTAGDRVRQSVTGFFVAGATPTIPPTSSAERNAP